MNKLTGVVLCGGRSLRMGTDKGLIPISDTTWAGHMAAILAQQGLEAVISVNSEHFHRYSVIFPHHHLVIDHHHMGFSGPLKGILSVHLQYPDHDMLVVACDMTDMQSEVLQTLITTYTRDKGFDFYAYHNGRYYEPLCGIYTSAGLKKANDNIVNSTRSDYSVQHVLKEGNTRQLPISPLHASSFKNFNEK